ncbi:hypothetical protein [Glycomyces algeriensis]|uniref:DUF3558 domain-containing protein n=1 Tax=Glycomyces algeriensis TaxID=256037 RepID=A0A9W6LDR2_9ACTN|nr:hypothetical protein [Glycomyces algeriensis]MDA1368757.1 hypothetical protein [Glycomyces algeriensis]MDR7352470.1 hypothetical protein [Glycomyces algeriensis]GLI40152.1 hypothetical protein GALLR39Z86_00020 [Glycomyces algeriensis]
MTYPSQPGYPTPQYGGQPPQPQQNNLWLIGGAVLTVLIIIMTVILLVVQRTQGSNNEGSGGDGTDTTQGTDEGGDTGGDDGGNDNGGDDNGGDDGGDAPATGLVSEACDAFDMTAFEEAFGPVDPDQTSRTETSTNGLGSLSCAFYNEAVTGVNMRINDYEDAAGAVDWVELDAEYYGTDSNYEFSEWTEYGDAGSFYTSTTSGTKSLYLNVAVGSLVVYVSSTLWEGEDVDEAAATAAMEDLVTQSGDLFADLT